MTSSIILNKRNPFYKFYAAYDGILITNIKILSTDVDRILIDTGNENKTGLEIFSESILVENAKKSIGLDLSFTRGIHYDLDVSGWIYLKLDDSCINSELELEVLF